MAFDHVGFEQFRKDIEGEAYLTSELIQSSVYPAIVAHYKAHNTHLSADERKAKFVERVRAETGYGHGVGGRHRSIRPKPVRTFLDNLKQGSEPSNFWAILVYYWFLTCEDTESDGGETYVHLVESRLYADFEGESTFESYFGKPVPVSKVPAALEHFDAQSSSSRSDDLDTSQRWQPSEYHPPTKFTDDQWLSPENPEGIPFVPRRNEMDKLDAFVLNEKTKFQIWTVIAPSGAGKTRLTLEWLRNSQVLSHWHKCILKPHQKADIGWRDWQPEKPTIVIIDYIHGLEGFIRALIDKFQDNEKSLKYPVKLLVLDHIFPQDFNEITKFSRWNLSDLSGTAIDRVGNHFYDKTPLFLDQSDDIDLVIRRIIAQVSGNSEDSQIIDEATSYLRKQKGAWHPLFAALVGFALKKGESHSRYGKWSRRHLIHYYLKGTDRLPWLLNTPEGVWASCFIIVATLRGKANPDVLMTYIPKNGSLIATHKKTILDLCNPVVSSRDPEKLIAFEPDILGENFFLLFLEQCLSKNVEEPFLKMLFHGDERSQASDVNYFIAFFRKLMRNLDNDNPNSKDVKRYWRCLSEFLNPTRFSASSHMSWSLNFLCYEFYLSKEHTGKIDLARTVLSRINKECFLKLPNGLNEMEYYVSIFHFFQNILNGDVTHFNDMSDLLDRYGCECEGDANPLMVASAVGCTSLVDYFIGSGRDLDAVNQDGVTALMLACELHQNEAANRLASACKNPDAALEDGTTALMIACDRGLVDVALILVERSSNLNATDSIGQTALIHACSHGIDIIANALIDQGADVDRPDKSGATALAYTCMLDSGSVADKLLKNGADTDVTLVSDGVSFTPLGIARANQSNDVIQILEKEKALELPPI